MPPKEDSARSSAAEAATERNVRTIAKLELAERLRRSRVEQIVDTLGRWAGKPVFSLAHAVWFAAWIGYNVQSATPFDPYPFTFLAFLVSLEAILLTSFVLAAQELMNQEADRRAKLNLQIDMLAEQELTAILRSIVALAEHSGLDLSARVPDLRVLTHETRVDRLAQFLEETEARVSREKPESAS